MEKKTTVDIKKKKKQLGIFDACLLVSDEFKKMTS